MAVLELAYHDPEVMHVGWTPTSAGVRRRDTVHVFEQEFRHRLDRREPVVPASVAAGLVAGDICCEWCSKMYRASV